MRRKSDRIFSLALVLSLLLSACGGGASASSMRLRKTEGTVRVSDDKGGDLEAREDLSLYSGYGLGTKDESYAWVDLDSVKLTKLDQNTRAEITKNGRDLEIVLKEGSLFFHVTEPLADDETMTIRVSTMAVGIRGTCGWVDVLEDGGAARVWLLEGKVRCEADGEHETVSAGETALLTEDGEITVETFSRENIPGYVLEEVEDREELLEDLPETGGPSGDGTDELLDEYMEVLKRYFYNDGDILYTEILDFEGDNSPELLLSPGNGINGDKTVTMYIFRKGPEKIERLYEFGTGSFGAGNRVALVESGGRLYLKHSVPSYDGDTSETYYGSVAEHDGAGVESEYPDWGIVESLKTNYNNGNIIYMKSLQGEHGLFYSFYKSDGYANVVSAEEYQTAQEKYTELKVLFYSPDGENFVVTPDSAEPETQRPQ